MRKEKYTEELQNKLRQDGYNLTGYQFEGNFIWIMDKARSYTFKESKIVNSISNVIGDLQGFSLHINEQVSELQGVDCRSNERRSYYRDVQRGLEIALQELNKIQGE